MRRLPSLSALRAFEAAARLRSFKAAAAELFVTPTAISHQVRALEEELGLRLFERRTRQVVPTAAADALYPVLRDGFDSFERAVASLGPRGRKQVTLTATTAFTMQWLLPRLPLFQAAHPGIDLRLNATNEVVELASGAADLAIRYGRGGYPGTIATPLIADRFLPLASPRLRVKTHRDLARHRLIHFDWHRPDPGHPSWPAWLRAARVQGIDAAAGLRFSDESHAIQAAIAGQGVALLSDALVAGELERGLLGAPFARALDGMTYSLVQSTERPSSPAIEAVRAWLLSSALAPT